MKKLLIISALVLSSLMSYGQELESRYSIGATGGGSVSSLGGGAESGVWFDFGKVGLSFKTGASLSNESPYDYIYGKSSKYVAGHSYTSLGAHVNMEQGFFFGGGAQRVVEISTSSIPAWTITPYINAGAQMQLNSGMIIRGEIVLGRVTSLNVGVGFNLN